MRDIFVTLKLTKIFLKSTLGDFSFGNKERKGNKLMWGILIFAFLPMVFSLCMGTAGGYHLLKDFGLEDFIIKIAVMVMVVLYFVTGIFYCISVFYYSKDNERVFAFPVKMWQILAARFMTTVVFEYLFLAVAFLPVIVTFGVISTAGILYYLYMLVVSALISVIPLSICTILVMLLMAFSKMFKNRDRVNIIGSVFLIVFIIAMNTSISTSLAKVEIADIKNVLDIIQNKVSKGINVIFLGSSFGADALTYYDSFMGFLFLLLFIGFCAGWFMLMLWAGSLLYKKGVLGLNSSSVKGRIIKKSEYDKYCRPRSRYLTYILKDIKVLLRTPVYLLNNALTIILVPVILLLSVVVPALGNDPEMGELIEFIGNSRLGLTQNEAVIALGIIFGIACFNASVNSIASTGVSREGSSAFYMKMIPYGFIRQLLTKASVGIMAGEISLIFILLITAYFFKASVMFLLIAFIISTAGIVALNISGIFIDALMPKLVWDSEQKAVKQNPNVVISMLVAAALGGGSIWFAFSGRPLVLHSSIDFVWVFIAGSLVFSGVVAGLSYYLMRANEKKIRSMIS